MSRNIFRKALQDTIKQDPKMGNVIQDKIKIGVLNRRLYFLGWIVKFLLFCLVLFGIYFLIFNLPETKSSQEFEEKVEKTKKKLKPNSPDQVKVIPESTLNRQLVIERDLPTNENLMDKSDEDHSKIVKEAKKKARSIFSMVEGNWIIREPYPGETFDSKKDLDLGIKLVAEDKNKKILIY